jgi:hypothetical protein
MSAKKFLKKFLFACTLTSMMIAEYGFDYQVTDSVQKFSRPSGNTLQCDVSND